MMIHSTAGHKPGAENVLHKIPVLATKPAFGTGKEVAINKQEKARKSSQLRRTGNIGTPTALTQANQTHSSAGGRARYLKAIGSNVTPWQPPTV